MLTLYQFPGPWDVCSASCFCAKVEAFMRWQHIPFTKKDGLTLKGAPKGKVPFIVDENGGMGDSDHIISYLCQKHGLQPDAGLTPAQAGQGRAIRYLCEEGLYRAMTYFRFVDEGGWQVLKAYFLQGFPGWVKPVAEWKIRGMAREQLRQHGLGRHSPEEITAMAKADLQALADMLGDQPFFFGDAMHVVDIVVFSVVANLVVPPFDNAVTRHARSMETLVAHSHRVREACFGNAA